MGHGMWWRKYGIAAREKNIIKPFWSVAAFTMSGFLKSSALSMGETRLVHRSASSLRNGSTTCATASGKRSGSSPWTIATTSATRECIASSTRSVQRSWVWAVMTTFPPACWTTSLIGSSQVATYTSSIASHNRARRRTCSTMGSLRIGARGLFGNREDSRRAGTTAMILFFTLSVTLLWQDAAVDVNTLSSDSRSLRRGEEQAYPSHLIGGRESAKCRIGLGEIGQIGFNILASRWRILVG